MNNENEDLLNRLIAFADWLEEGERFTKHPLLTEIKSSYLELFKDYIRRIPVSESTGGDESALESEKE